MKEQEILKALEAIMDPDLGRNIVELGFVQNLKISKEKDVSFDLVLTTPACPIKDKFKKEAESILKNIGAKSVEVTISGKTTKPKMDLAKNSMLKDVSHIVGVDRKSTRLNSSHVRISYAVFC